MRLRSDSTSAGYNFLRWIGAAIAPVLSGFLAQVISPRVPFALAAVLLVVSITVLNTRRSIILRGLRQQEVRTGLRKLGFEQADDYLRDRHHRRGVVTGANGARAGGDTAPHPWSTLDTGSSSIGERRLGAASERRESR
ncbi:MAG: hypothetical protein M1118_00075 [Chloroflexi bacterium]|nr:hypothetical protein [Chloroflexota bacterium]